MLKTYALPAAIIYTIALIVLSLVRVSDMPEFGTDYDDKIYHIIAYVILTLLWYFAFKSQINKNQILILALSCSAFGIVIEVLQERLTTYRVNDTLDIVANVVGVLLGITYIFYRRKNLS